MAAVIGRYKLVLLGEQSVGKTAVCTRFMHDSFDESYQATIGIDFLAKTLYLRNSSIRLQIWDTAGQERFHSLIPAYIRDCSAALIVYDVTKADSFHWVDKWIEDVRLQQESSPRPVIAIVGNKADLTQLRQVSFDEGLRKAADNSAIFFETSAKTGVNIRQLFTQVAEALLKRDLEAADNGESDATGETIYNVTVVPSQADSNAEQTGKIRVDTGWSSCSC